MSYGKKVEPELSDMPLKTTALVIIDMQNDAMAMVPAGREVIPAIRRILDVCRASDISIIHKIRVHRSDGIDVELFRAEMFKRNPFLVNGTRGAEIVSELKPHEGEFVISVDGQGPLDGQCLYRTAMEKRQV